MDTRLRTICKTLTDKVMEISLSSLIMFLLGFPIGLVIGLPILIEAIQILVYVFNERLWSQITWETTHEGHICEECQIFVCPCPFGKHPEK